MLVLDEQSEHVGNGIAPVVEGTLGNLHAPADVIVEPFPVQFLKRNLLCPMDGLYHPDVFADEALSPVVVNHKTNFIRIEQIDFFVLLVLTRQLLTLFYERLNCRFKWGDFIRNYP